MRALVPNAGQGLMRRASRPKPIREALEVLLEYRFQQHGYRPLQHLILDGRHTDATSLLAIALRNVDPLDRRSEIAAALHALEQSAQVLLEMLAVITPALSIDSRSTVRFDPLIGCLQPIHGQVVVQGREAFVRSLPSQFRYPLLYRAHVF